MLKILQQMEHHGQRKCHQGNQEDHHRILRLLHFNVTDKKYADHNHCHMDHQKEVRFRNPSAEDK